MKRSPRAEILGIALWTLATGSLAGDFPGVAELMTESEYEQAGLDKLSDTEREALNAWLLRYTAFEAETVKQVSVEVKEKEKEFKPITTRIVGPFKGWSGKTRFRLENGQVWQQRMKKTYQYHADNPEVEIYRNWAGYYWMKVLATGKAVPVTRIE